MTRTEFEQLIPALRDVDGVPFRVCQDEMKAYIVQLKKDLLLTTPTGEDRVGELPEAVQTALERTAAVGAAAKMLPTLDLTYTPEGFAVRRNDQLTPASTERVQALRRQLYEQEAVLWSELVDLIVGKGDALLPDGARQQLTFGFGFTPMRAARMGLTPADVVAHPAAQDAAVRGWTMANFRAAVPRLTGARNKVVGQYLGRQFYLQLITLWIDGSFDIFPEHPTADGYVALFAAIKLMVRTGARVEATFARTGNAGVSPAQGAADVHAAVNQLATALRAIHDAAAEGGFDDTVKTVEATHLWKYLTGTDRAFHNTQESGVYFF